MPLAAFARYARRLEATSSRTALIGVLADEITRSSLHAAGRDGGRGYALRFPRLAGFHEADKRPEDATTVAELIALYTQQGGSAAPG